MQELRSLLTDRPSRQHTATLWKMAERITREALPELVREALQLSGNDWRDKEVAARLLERMTQLDPTAAADLVAQLEGAAKVPALTQLASLVPEKAPALLSGLTSADLSRVLSHAVALDRI